MVKYLVFCVLVASGYLVYSNFPVNHGPGITAKEEPKIERLTWQEPFTFKGATFTPKKIIDAEVRVIKKKRYFFDSFSKYSPVDAIVGWNELSDSRNLDYIYFQLGEREFELDPTRPPLSVPKIYGESDLWHLIPSTAEIDKRIKSLRDGEIIKIGGLLVDISNEADYQLKTNTELSESTKPNGFIIWIEDFHIR
ncbi:hypothetical protein [Gracilimonas halophila]|uniref:Uncharacterized protein n=1 Tax=Gracilimonas halophila TaxID=1834464 RepID=A0ABW5JKT4_9BACT